MNQLELTKELYVNLVNWMKPKYAIGTIHNRSAFLLKMFKTYKIYNQEVLRKIMKSIKYQSQRASLVMINNYCYDNEIDFHLIIPSIKKQSRKLPNILSIEEIKLMIKSVPKPYDLVLRCIFNMGAGLRISEIIKMKWNDIRWIDWLEHKEDYGIAIIKSGKGSKDRIVNIPKLLMQDLYNYAKETEHLNEFRVPCGSMIFDFGLSEISERRNRKIRLSVMGNTEEGKDIYLKTRYDWFRTNIIKKYCEKALDKHIKIHSLRHCICEETEILTINGWKNYNDLSIGDEVFSYNLNMDCIERDNILNIHRYNYKGELDRIINTYIDAQITPEHRVVVKEITKKIKPDKWSCKPFSEVNKKCWNISHKLSAVINNTNKTIGVNKAGLLGWILSDGRISNRDRPSISISQSYSANKEKCEYIEKLLVDSNTPYTKTIKNYSSNNFSKNPHIMCNFYILKGGDHGSINIGDYHNWIYKYIDKNRTPKLNNILMLSTDELKELYNCMMMGDGTHLNYNNREYCGQNEKRIELVRILCVLLGHTSTQKYKIQNGKKYSRLYIIENKNYTQIKKQNSNFSKIKYNGVVWCPETRNSTFIAKNNEKIFITGNSKATYLYEVEKVPIEKIQVLLGHSSINTTMLYTKINPLGVFESIKNTNEI